MNYSLCHGFAGNAEILLYGTQVLGPSSDVDVRLAERVGNVGIESCAEKGHEWPCGTGGGETPGLMLGQAGIGHFYLRLHDPDVPSILIPRREGFLHRLQAASG